MIDVGEDGDIHVIFYDDRRYNDLSDQKDFFGTTNPKYDVYYAFTDDQGENWDNIELFADPAEPTIDYADLPAGPKFLVRDYIGIDVGADRVWTCFMGTADADLPDPNDPNDTRDPSVIWSSQILPE